jgi:hypothetical protein
MEKSYGGVVGTTHNSKLAFTFLPCGRQGFELEENTEDKNL